MDSWQSLDGPPIHGDHPEECHVAQAGRAEDNVGRRFNERAAEEDVDGWDTSRKEGPAFGKRSVFGPRSCETPLRHRSNQLSIEFSLNMIKYDIYKC